LPAICPQGIGLWAEKRESGGAFHALRRSDHCPECCGDDGVSALSRMLISLCCGRGGMAEASHELAHRGALLSGEGSGGVAQVMEVQALLSGGGQLLAGSGPDSPKGGGGSGSLGSGSHPA
jgi:hypothetical protein